MYNKILLFVCFSLSTITMKAQWSKNDSLNLNRLIKGDKEININPKEVEHIRFDNNLFNTPYTNPIQINSLNIDETLPEAKKKIILTLHPYTVNTRYDWDPIYHCKIIQVGNHWEPIQSPLYFNDKARANNLMANILFSLPKHAGIRIGTGTYIEGTSITGLDLMSIFERKFWDKAGEARRARTLELLKHYNDLPTKKFLSPVQTIQNR
jgi:hypothetical protein